MSKIKTSNSNQSQSLAKSIIWEQMHKYYEELGPVAWQKDLVPYQITSNKVLAHLYANIIFTIIYQQHQNRDPLAADQPYYILELGAGHGKFSFYMCKLIERLNATANFKIVYIASDISEKNIAAWQTHPQLLPYINNNTIDFAKFDASSDKCLELINSKQTINIKSLHNNLFVIANYIFDSLAHDAFKCKNNQLFSGTINLHYKNKFSLENFDYKYSYKLTAPDYYDNSLFNQLLSEYRQQLPKGVFLLPVGGLQAISNIQQFSMRDTIFLVADKGNTDLADFNTKHDPAIAKHGSVSFMVNFHAVEKFFNLNKGASFIQGIPYTDLKIGCFINSDINNYPSLKFLLDQILYDVHPLNIINLSYTNDKVNNFASLEQVLALLVVSKWDPDLFYDLSVQLINLLEKSLKKQLFNTEQQADLLSGLELVAGYFFKLGLEQDVPFVLANIYYILEKFELAINYFQKSIDMFGETAESWYNLALCYRAQKKNKLAQQAINKALGIKPNYKLAKKLLV